MRTNQECQSSDGILVDPHQPSGLADAALLGEMLKDGQDLLMREFGVEERGALELGEAIAAGPAKEEAMTRPGEMIDDEQVSSVALAEA